MVVTARTETALGQRSSYLKYLPGIYSQDDFMGRFLMIFESILGPLEGMVDNLAYYFDPGTTPPELLPWLAGWVDLVLDERWPLERHRALVKSAVQLWRWRGTRRGLKEYLRVYTGVEPKITEDCGGIPLGQNARLGWNTVLGGGHQFTFDVTLELEDPRAVNVEHLKAIIEAEKPAHAAYRLSIVKRGS